MNEYNIMKYIIIWIIPFSIIMYIILTILGVE
jgi:hypothetical protein